MEPVTFCSADHLTLALVGAVPLKIAEYVRKGGPSPEDYIRAGGNGDLVKTPQDLVQYRDGLPAESFAMFEALADALAVMSFLPQGASFGCHRWKTEVPDGGAG